MNKSFLDNGPSIIDGTVNSEKYNKNSNDEYDLYLRAKKNSETKRQAVKKRKKKKMARNILIAATLAVAVASPFGVEQFKGNDCIRNEFENIICNYGVTDDSVNGFRINMGNQVVSFDYGVSSMVNEARNAGMDDIDIYIAIKSKFNESTAKEYVRDDVKLSEKIAAKKKAYHESELKKLNSKGASK